MTPDMPGSSATKDSDGAAPAAALPPLDAANAKPARPAIDSAVEAELAAIPSLSRAELMERWVQAYGRKAPKGISRRLLEYVAAYQLQVRAYGGLSPAARRTLQRVAAAPPREAVVEAARVTAPKSPPPGTRLVREWHGRVYTVETLDRGFACDGRQFRSLSEVARHITGVHWSGPRFFGL